MSEDEMYMHRCLQLAALGSGKVSPNPMVGAVLVHEGKIIGEGWHQYYGGAHAEVNCFESVPADLQHLFSKATLYVSLEPCSHFGKTPPCAQLIIQNKILKLVVGCRDSFALVNGAGIAAVKDAAIAVVEDVLVNECREMNKRFFTVQEKGRPYIFLKWAASADGFISKQNEQSAISSHAVNILMHKWRTEEDAIMIGTKTALMDNPELTSRHWEGRNATRIIIDRGLKLPVTLNIFNAAAPTIVINCLKNEQVNGIKFIKVDDDAHLLGNILKKLVEQNLQSIIVEGGAQLLSSFLKERLWDEAIIIKNTSLFLENGTAAPALLHAHLQNRVLIESNEVQYFKNLQQQ